MRPLTSIILQLRSNPPTGTLTLVHPSDGDLVRYNLVLDVFGVMTRQGTVKTYFRPNPNMHDYSNNLEYFYGQYF